MTNPNATPAPLDASQQHLLGRLTVLELQLARLVTEREAGGGDRLGPRGTMRFSGVPATPDPPTDPAAAARLAEVEHHANAAAERGEALRLRTLATSFGLTEIEVELLLLAAAPDLDAGLGHRYAALHGNDDQVQLSPALALWLLGLHTVNAEARRLLDPTNTLVRTGLLESEPATRRLLGQQLRVPERVLVHLLGSASLPEPLASTSSAPVAVPGPTAEAIARALRAGLPLVYVQDRNAGVGVNAAVAALEQLDRTPVVLDLAHRPSEVDLATLARLGSREALLRGGVLVVTGLDALPERDAGGVRRFADADAPSVLVGRANWDPGWAQRVPAVVAAEAPAEPVRRKLWDQALDAELAAEVDAAAATAQFRLSPEQILRSGQAATRQALSAGQRLTGRDVRAGARAQNSTGLSRLARRIRPSATWDDLILPASVEAELRSLVARWRQRGRVLDDWGLSPGSARGRGVSGLFAGGSGTGKTLSAEVLANDLGLDLYVIELSTVIDKYIGETSKNLARIFDEADSVNGVLLFDEADALFGKRSAVSDAKDRHANVEVAFLLQRMESFDGVAILTTNLAANLDEAFLRRLDAIVDFPEPTVAQRRELWARMLPESLPRAELLDLDLLAESFKLSGSEIRSTALRAAYRVADEGRTLTNLDLLRAVVAEHRKLGRHLGAQDLGRYAGLLEE